jgi:hypothetical protein
VLTGQIGLRRHGAGIIAKGIEWATYSHTHHVIVAISETQCVSAEPGGARIRDITDYPSVDWSDFPLTDLERANIVFHARGYADNRTPYNYAIYPPLLFQRLTGHKVDGWVAEWLSKRPNENCSQLCGDVYTAAGIHLFAEISEIVTPGDFERLFIARGWLPNP